MLQRVLQRKYSFQVHASTAADAPASDIRVHLPWNDCNVILAVLPTLLCRSYGAVEGRLELGGFMALMKDNMLDAREVLAYLGARPESPTTTRAVIHVRYIMQLMLLSFV
jgi:hypothetical protein